MGLEHPPRVGTPAPHIHHWMDAIGRILTLGRVGIITRHPARNTAQVLSRMRADLAAERGSSQNKSVGTRAEMQGQGSPHGCRSHPQSSKNTQQCNKVKFWMSDTTTHTCYPPQAALLTLIDINSCRHSRDEYRVDTNRESF